MMGNGGGFGLGGEDDFVDGLDSQEIVEEPPHPPRVEIVDHQGLCIIGPEVDDDLLSFALKF